MLKLTRKQLYKREMRAKKRLIKEKDKDWFWECLELNCEVCGEPSIQVHHFFPKSLYPELRHDLQNGISLCMGCHFKHHHRGDPMIHQTIIEKRGKKWLNNLKSKIKKPINHQEFIKSAEIM